MLLRLSFGGTSQGPAARVAARVGLRAAAWPLLVSVALLARIQFGDKIFRHDDNAGVGARYREDRL